MLNGFENLWILILIALWTLPWKGVALWRAAHRGEKKWFIALLILNTLAVLEILYIFIFSKKSQQKSEGSTKAANENPRREEEGGALSAARSAIQSKKEEAKERIISAILQRGQISNADVEILLNVSDATATRYLDELESEGKIKQKGDVGRGVIYLPK